MGVRVRAEGIGAPLRGDGKRDEHGPAAVGTVGGAMQPDLGGGVASGDGVVDSGGKHARCSATCSSRVKVTSPG